MRVGAVRTALLSAKPIVSDVVLTGENRDYVGGIAWLNAAEAGRLQVALHEVVAADYKLTSCPAGSSSIASSISALAISTTSEVREWARPPLRDSARVVDPGAVGDVRD